MICKNYKKGEKVKVTAPKESIVLVERSNTTFTELEVCIQKTGMEEPPQILLDREFFFFIIAGTATIIVGTESYNVKPHDLIYVPANLAHQIAVNTKDPLEYLIFKFFLSKADISQGKGCHVADIMTGRFYDFGANDTILVIDSDITARCEATVVTWPAGNKGPWVAHEEKEQTFFVLSGNGWVSIGNETQQVKVNDVVFVPVNTPHTTEGGADGLTYLCANAYVRKPYANFAEMYAQKAPKRIERWKNNDQRVGE